MRLALALQKADPQAELTVFLMGDAVLAAKAGQKTPEGYYNFEHILGRVILAKGAVLLCGTGMAPRGIGDTEMIVGAQHSTMDALASATTAVDKVLVF
jgi:uncharacterized protein involved in oxidation of intracellular sulfur